MVASNPLYSGWSVQKFQATVINDVWPEVLFFSSVAAMVSAVTQLTKHSLGISNALLTVLGTVLGLVISFRTSTAYERYQEGRKLWTTIIISSRHIAQMIWVHVPTERTDKNKRKLSTLESIIEKKSMVNLVQAFSVAVKHFLRDEAGIYFEDLYPLICFLPRYATTTGEPTAADMLPLWDACDDEEFPLTSAPTTAAPTRANTPSTMNLDAMTNPDLDKIAGSSWRSARRTGNKAFDPEAALADIQAHRPLKPSRNPPQTTLLDYFPFFRIFVWLFSSCSRRLTRRARNMKSKHAPLTESNVPLEITIYLNAYIAHLISNAWVMPALATGLLNNVSMLQDCMTNLDRIASTPLPFAYQAHLRMSLWMYLFFLPFQIVEPFGWLTIPGTAFASFLLLGFLEIGQEIENPFNYDLNDLDLDAFCLSIQRELHEITAHTSPDPTQFVFSAWNQPFAPTDRRSAEELLNDEEYTHADHGDAEPGISSIRRILLRNWKDVDRMTRE
ncbi:unnamed protein product [Mycena citricolor]|uniref:Uncharacterized protein n=1 Tax=Mycena citricolor TaxID=2018698 RepID=A0AAD2H6L5_9AGAR|nr:unnamed protein product [Mycena citricolor]